MRPCLLCPAVLAVVGSACLGAASPAVEPGHVRGAHVPVRIVLADARDLRATVVTLGRNAAARSIPLPGRSGGDPPVTLAAVGGGVVFYGRDGPYAMPGSLAGGSRRLHRGLYFVPSAEPGRVWVAIQDPREPGLRLVRRVVEVTTAGRPVLSSRHRPPSRNIVAAVRAGLLVETDTGIAVWDPRTGRTVRTLPGSFPAAVHGNLVAWCAFRCAAMHITDARTGADRVIPHISSHAWEETYGGAISADGRYLALPIRSGRAQQVALVDLPRSTSRLIPGPRLAAGHPALGWDPARNSLYYAAAGGAVARYSVGAARAVSLPIHVAGGFTSLAVLR
jgi:hypothetical protein